MCANNRIHCGPMVVFVCLHFTLPHYLHYEDVSEGIELLKYLSGAFCRVCVSKIKSILPIIFYTIYGAVCIQLTHFSYKDCQNMCISYYYHHQIRSIIQLPLFRITSGVCLSISFFCMSPEKWDTQKTHSRRSSSIVKRHIGIITTYDKTNIYQCEWAIWPSDAAFARLKIFYLPDTTIRCELWP